MESLTFPRRLSCPHYVHEDTSGYDYRHPRQYGDLQVSAFPVHAYPTSCSDTVPYNPPSLIDIQSSLDTSSAALNVGFSGVDGHSSGSHDFFGIPRTILPQGDEALILDDHFGDWSLAPNSASLPSTVDDLPPLLDQSDNSAQNKIDMTEFGDFGGLSNVGTWHMGFSELVGGQPHHADAVSYPVSCNTGHGYADGSNLVDFCMPDARRDFTDLPFPPALTTQHQPPGILLSQMTTFEACLGLPVQNEGHWYPESHRDSTNKPFQVPPYQLPPNGTFQISNNTLTNSGGRLLLDVPESISGQPTKIENVKKYTHIVAKHIGYSTTNVEAIASSNLTNRDFKKVHKRRTLTPEEKKRVAKMREKKACLRCRQNHITCSRDKICIPCRKSVKSPIENMCPRGHLEQFFEFLLPEFLVGHLDQAVIKATTSTVEFIENERVLEMSTGGYHPPIPVLVCEYIPPNQDFLLVPDSAPGSDGKKLTLAYGLHNSGEYGLKENLRKHAEAVSNLGNISGSPGTLTWKVLQAVFCFQKADPVAKQNGLLRQAFLIHSIHYFKGVLITFHKDSAHKALRNLQNPPANPPSPHHLSAKLLNMQIKGILNDLLKDLQMQFLNDFDEELNRLGKNTSLLCLDRLVKYKIRERIEDPEYIVRCGTEICRKLEMCAVEHSSLLLGAKLKPVLKKYNFFRHGFPVDDTLGHSKSEIAFVNRLRQIMVDYDDQIKKRGADNCFGGSLKQPEDYEEYERSDRGRLISKVLMKLPDLYHK